MAKSHQANPFFCSYDRRLSAPPELFLVYSPIRHATNGVHRDMLIFYINTNFFITLDFYCPGISTSCQMPASLPDPNSPYNQSLRNERQNSVWYPSRPHLIMLFAPARNSLLADIFAFCYHLYGVRFKSAIKIPSVLAN